MTDEQIILAAVRKSLSGASPSKPLELWEVLWRVDYFERIGPLTREELNAALRALHSEGSLVVLAGPLFFLEARNDSSFEEVDRQTYEAGVAQYKEWWQEHGVRGS